jgi:hypothetical protein
MSIVSPESRRPDVVRKGPVERLLIDLSARTERSTTVLSSFQKRSLHDCGLVLEG